jgi:subtilisin family serine protease
MRYSLIYKLFLLPCLSLFVCKLARAGEYYYYYKGGKQLLDINTGSCFIASEKEITAEYIAAANVGGLKIEQTGTGIKSNLSHSETDSFYQYWAELSFDSQKNEQDYLKDLESLKRLTGVIYVGPSFKLPKTEKYIGASNYLYIKIKSLGDSAVLSAYAKKNDCQAIRQNEFMPLWYMLRYTDNRNVKSILDIANNALETGLFNAAEPDFMSKDKLTCVNDTYFNDQWGVKNTGQFGGGAAYDVNACEAWAITTGKPNIKVAVIDCGIQYNHPDLVISESYDAQGTSATGIYYPYTHATNVAGVINAIHNNNYGIAGVAPLCKLMNISLSLSGDNLGFPYFAANGINYAWQHGASVINNSWQEFTPSQMIDDAIQNALTFGRNGLGTVLVFATANENQSTVAYPANSNPLILAVGAMSPCGERKNYTSCDISYFTPELWGSNYGSSLDVIAPGVGIKTTEYYDEVTPTYNNAFWGTSAAAPFVSSIAALVLSENPCLTVKQVNDIIERSSQKVGTGYATVAGRPNGSWNIEKGYGLVDAYQAVILARTLYLQAEAVTTTQLRTATNIYAGYNVTSAIPTGNYNINPTANLTLKAKKSIQLKPGTRVFQGARFRAYISNLDECIDTSVLAPSPIQINKIVKADSKAPSELNPLSEGLNKFIIYPNPFTTTIKIDWLPSSHPQDYIITISNIYGRTIMKKSFSSNTSEMLSLPTAMPSGVYFITIKSATEKYTKKIIKL